MTRVDLFLDARWRQPIIINKKKRNYAAIPCFQHTEAAGWLKLFTGILTESTCSLLKIKPDPARFSHGNVFSRARPLETELDDVAFAASGEVRAAQRRPFGFRAGALWRFVSRALCLCVYS